MGRCHRKYAGRSASTTAWRGSRWASRRPTISSPILRRRSARRARPRSDLLEPVLKIATIGANAAARSRSAPQWEVNMDPIERRVFMQGAMIGSLAFVVDGVETLLTPRQAYAQGVALRTLKPEEARTLEAVGEALVPGARTAGIVPFVDQQISIAPEEALLEARIMNVRPPFADFYRAALGAIERASKAHNGERGFADLDAAAQ